MEIEKRINELTELLNEANYQYYIEDNSIITDQEFDKYLKELTELEMEYPVYKRNDSPCRATCHDARDSYPPPCP